jgi:hypothetical protein
MYNSRGVEGPVPAESNGPLLVLPMSVSHGPYKTPKQIRCLAAETKPRRRSPSAAVERTRFSVHSPRERSRTRNYASRCGGPPPGRARPDHTGRWRPSSHTGWLGAFGRLPGGNSRVCLAAAFSQYRALALPMPAHPMPAADRWLYARARPHG